METYKNLKKSTKIGLLISFALVCFVLTCVLIDLVIAIGNHRVIPLIHISTHLVILVSIFLYGIYGYKKPHGNMLRCLFFAFGGYLIVYHLIPVLPQLIIEECSVLSYVYETGMCLSALLAVYISGRLDKIEKNKILMIVTGIVLLISTISMFFVFNTFSFLATIQNFVKLTSWAVLCFAYVARYEDHKTAGLEDK